ncbi:MAG: HAD hydrolase family protein, partial [Alkalibacterium sp.]
KAVKALAEHLGIDRKDVMAIGDSGNDVDLVDFAGIGVAMDNATDEVKAVADVVTTSNNEHGVAQAIYKYALD